MGCEEDQKHAAKVVKKNLTSNDRRVSTPGEDLYDHVNGSESGALEEMKSFRADATRGNYLIVDRPDLQFSAKEISRAMSKPTKKDQRRIVNVAKYLTDFGNQRVQPEFKFGALDTIFTVRAASY